eukprot:CFRG2801T1
MSAGSWQTGASSGAQHGIPLRQQQGGIPSQATNNNLWLSGMNSEGGGHNSFSVNQEKFNQQQGNQGSEGSYGGSQFVERQLQQQLLNQRQLMYNQQREMMLQQPRSRVSPFTPELDSVAAQNLAIEQIARQRQMSASFSPTVALGSPMQHEQDSYRGSYSSRRTGNQLNYQNQLSNQGLDLNIQNMQLGYNFNSANGSSGNQGSHGKLEVKPMLEVHNGNRDSFGSGDSRNMHYNSRSHQSQAGVFLNASSSAENGTSLPLGDFVGGLNVGAGEGTGNIQGTNRSMAFEGGGKNNTQIAQPPPQPKQQNVLIPESMLPHNLIDQGGEVNIVDDLLAISNSPSQFGRFRYKSEQRERPLSAEKGFPEVTLNPAYASLVPVGALVTVRIVTKTTNDKLEVSPHFHELGGSNEAPLLGVIRRAVFDNLTVLMSKHSGSKTEVKRNKDDQRACRLLFELQFTSNEKTVYGYTISHPIFNAKLMINKLSAGFGACTGQNEVILLCSKVRKATTTVVISDAAMLEVLGDKISGKVGTDTVRHDEAKWNVDPQTNMGFCVLPLRIIQFHHQYAIVIEMPPYHNLNIMEGYPINIQIIDFEDGTESAPARYVYLPSEDAKHQWSQENKKRKMDDGMRDFWQQFS